MLGGVAVFGAATILFGLSRSFPLSVFELVALGAAGMVSVVVRSTLLQTGAPDAKRSRVRAVNPVFHGAPRVFSCGRVTLPVYGPTDVWRPPAAARRLVGLNPSSVLP